MVPDGLTISSMLTNAGVFVTAYSSLIIIVVGVMLGVFGVWFVVDLVRAAFRR
jgi:ABC-type microcin C transport system permease subunit YejE